MKLFYCIIEDINDPLKLGRVKLRIVGKHTSNISDSTDVNYLPLSDLPWAQSLSPTTSPNISGQCNFSVPAQGSLGICSFMDEDEQIPILFGTLPRVLQELPDFTKGFSDPDSINPIAALLTESQISRIARNENISSTIIQTKIAGIETSIDANGEVFNEPATQYDTVYPDNKVIETKSGHVIEIDDTSGKERIDVYHKSGSFIEFHPNGDLVTNIKGKNYTIAITDDNIYVKGNQNIRIEGDQNVEIAGDQKIKVVGDATIEAANANITASAIVTITGTTKVDIVSSTVVNVTAPTITITGSTKVDIISSTLVNLAAPTVSIGGAITMVASGSADVSITSGGATNITASGAASIAATGAVVISGSTISLN